MNEKVMILIFGMAIVTYIPRMLPAILIEKMKFGAKFEKFLQLIPYTAMASLIFPGVFVVDENNYSIGIVGALMAILLGFKKCPVMICVLGAILADLLLYSFL